MSEADQEHEAIDRLVGEHLERRAGSIDATDLIRRVRSMRAEAGQSPPAVTPADSRRAGLPRWAGWMAVTAAGLFLAFLGGRYLGPAAANAGVVLKDVRAVHADGLDRCYHVQFAPDVRYWNKKNKLEGPSQSVLWTRGDRFWSDCQIGELRLAIGQEADGSLWVSPSAQKGIRFGNDPQVLPADVALICAINSMRVPRLVDEVLADFDLRVEDAPNKAERTLIWATLKPGHSHTLLSDALLEIDTQQNLLTRMVLWTVRKGQPKGTVTYTLVDSSPQDDAQYELTTHLDDDAEIEIHQLREPVKK